MIIFCLFSVRREKAIEFQFLIANSSGYLLWLRKKRKKEKKTSCHALGMDAVGKLWLQVAPGMDTGANSRLVLISQEFSSAGSSQVLITYALRLQATWTDINSAFLLSTLVLWCLSFTQTTSKTISYNLLTKKYLSGWLRTDSSSFLSCTLLFPSPRKYFFLQEVNAAARATWKDWVEHHGQQHGHGHSSGHLRHKCAAGGVHVHSMHCSLWSLNMAQSLTWLIDTLPLSSSTYLLSWFWQSCVGVHMYPLWSDSPEPGTEAY